MPTSAAETVAVVLAAGASSRFGSPKTLAELEGRPLLQHVLDTAASLGLAGVVLVLGRDAGPIARAVDPRGADIVLNPEPERGLSSSLRLGLEWANDHHPVADAALILLGDQPRVRPGVVRALLDAHPAAGRTIVVPAYAAGGGRNPALLLRDAWPLAATLEGDRGMGEVIAARPELVTEVAVEGDNPDVDTRDDLRRMIGTAARDARPGGIT